jgi:hypothetical protein
MKDSSYNNRFRISLPDDCVDQSLYLFNGPEVSGVQHNLTLVVDRILEDDSLEAFAQERIDIFMDSTPGTELVKQEMTTLANGKEACVAVVKWIPVEGTIIFQKRVYLVIDEIGYTFVANFTKQTLKTIGLQVDGIIDSFQPETG